MLAYLDANSGSLIVSAIAAGAAGIAVVAKTGARRFTGMFRSKTESAPDVADETDQVAGTAD